MASLRPVGRSAATLDKDRVSLCRFTFGDGRQGRTHRASNGWAVQWRDLSPSAPSASLPPSAIILLSSPFSPVQVWIALKSSPP